LGVEVVDDDLPPADAAMLVAPGGERDGGVVHLLVQAGALGGAPVGHDAEADLLGGQPDLGGLPGLAVPADLLELAEAPAVEPAAALVAPAGRRPGGGVGRRFGRRCGTDLGLPLRPCAGAGEQ